MAEQIGEMYVSVKADTSALQKKIAADTEAAGQKASASFGKKFAVGIGAAAAGLGAVAVGATASVVALGRSYEDSMLKFQAVSGASEADMKRVSQAAKDLGNDLTLPGVSAKDAADAMLELGKAGFTVDQSIAGADGTMRLAVAGQLEVGRAAEIASNALLSFNLSASESGRVADLLAAGANASSVEVEDIAQATAQAGSLFAAANIPIEDLVTQIGLLGNAGIKGSDAGTSLKTMIQRLQSPTDKAAKAMQQLGVNVYDAQGQMLPMENIVEQFTNATSGLSEEQRAQALNTIFGADAIRAANIVLTQGADKYTAMADAVTKTGAANEMAAATTKGLSGAIEAIQSQIETIGIEVYEQIAPSLTEVFRALGPVIEQLAPVIGELGKALAQIATAAGGALVSALKVLIPAITPLIQFLGELGVRLGPIVTMILGKLAQVISRVMDVVMPLLQPLSDLIFTLLDALWPIVEIVIDVLLSLVDALKPLLEAVMAVLTPIVQLVNVGLKAIMPVLKPLMPIIELLAKILGDVLIRAIGLLMVAIGGMITGWTKAAQFILDHFIDPVMDAFFTFVGNIVRGAAEAFGWVPGIGDDLQKAAGSFDQWAADTKKTIKGAAQTAVDEGAKIAKGLVDDGAAMLVSGESKTKLYGAGQTLGGNIPEGMAAGIANKSSLVTDEAQKMSMRAINSAKTTLDSHSPSRVFMQIGGDVVSGFEIGLKDMDKIPEKFREPLQKAIDASNEKLDTLVKDVRKRLDDAKAAFKDYQQAAMNALSGGLNVGDAWRMSTDSQDAMDTAFRDLEDARKKLAAAQAEKNKDGSARDVSSEQEAVARADAAYQAAKASVVTFEQAWQQQIAKVNLGRDVLGQLNSQIAGTEGGVMLMQQLFSLPIDQATVIAQNLLGTETQPNSLLGQITGDLQEQSVWNGAAAKQWAIDAKGAGVQQALDAVKGIKKQVKAEQDNLEKIGASMGDGLVIGFKSKDNAFKAAVRSFVRATEEELGIRSPSRVFMGIGEDVAAGLNIGVEKNLNPVVPVASAPQSVRMYAPAAMFDESIQSAGVVTDVRVYLGDKELTDLVDVQIQANDSRQRDLVIAGRRF